MAVVYVRERFQERSATWGIDGRTYIRTFFAKTDDKLTGPVEVETHPDVPKPGSVHPEDSSAYLINLTTRPIVDETATGWLIQCEYDSEDILDTDPTQDGPQIEWTTEQFQRPAVYDQNNNLVVNSAGDPFDPPAMRDDSRLVVTCKRNVATVPTWLLSYRDAVNDDAFTIDGVAVDIGKAKCQRVSVSDVNERNGTTFRTVTLVLHFRDEGWLLSILDAGFREVPKKGGCRINIRNECDDDLPTGPVPLDGFGNALLEPSFDNAVFLDFEVYTELPFSVLAPIWTP